MFTPVSNLLHFNGSRSSAHTLQAFAVPLIFLLTLERSVEPELAGYWFLFCPVVILLYGAFLVLSPFLKALTWAAILAVLFYPADAWSLDLLRGKASWLPSLSLC